MAHDFNNVLQAVEVATTLAKQRLEIRPEAARRSLDIVAAAAERGAAITNRLLAFARRSELSATRIECRPLLEDVALLLRHTLGPGVALRVEAGPDVPALFADPGQLETVLVNLANNARDALKNGRGTIRLRGDAGSGPGANVPAQLAPGRYVCLSVVDDGVGMTAEVLARATEAFFTTKPKGQGTGLGVAMAGGFAEQSGGALTIDSTFGLGTTVSLWLPVAPADAIAASQPDGAARGAAASSRAGTAILLVDDEPALRSVLAELLDDEGDTVMEANDAAAALAALESGAVVDVLVTDLAMSGSMDGLELIRQARRRRPGLPAVLVTGHFDDAAATTFHELAKDGPFAVLGKPFTAKTLTAQIANLLGG